jgi:hypothetical protein
VAWPGAQDGSDAERRESQGDSIVTGPVTPFGVGSITLNDHRHHFADSSRPHPATPPHRIIHTTEDIEGTLVQYQERDLHPRKLYHRGERTRRLIVRLKLGQPRAKFFRHGSSLLIREDWYDPYRLSMSFIKHHRDLKNLTEVLAQHQPRLQIRVIPLCMISRSLYAMPSTRIGSEAYSSSTIHL